MTAGRVRGLATPSRRRVRRPVADPRLPVADPVIERLIGRPLAAHTPQSLHALQRLAGNSASTRLIESVRRRPSASPPVVAQRDKLADKAAAAKKAAAEATALKAMKAAFTYPFWLLAEGKGVRAGSSGDASVLIDGVAIRFLPDRFLTESEFVAAGGTFKNDRGSSAAVTNWSYDGIDWDPKSVQTADLGGGNVMVQDYKEPVARLSIQTTYRKSGQVKSLEAARRRRSGYGKGYTLGDHEASHAADAVAYVRADGPRLPTLVGSPMMDFNAELANFFAAAKGIGTAIAGYSRGKTDCPGTRNAAFCPVVRPARTRRK